MKSLAAAGAEPSLFALSFFFFFAAF
jgi:hypothetical protein